MALSHKCCELDRTRLLTTKKTNKEKTFSPITKLLLLHLIFTILFSFSTQSASAWTFEDRAWWFSTGGNSNFDIANVAITFTYPDRLEVGEVLEVAVILEYIDNQMANADYAIFSDVQVRLSELSTRKEIGRANGNNYIPIRNYEPRPVHSSDKDSSEVVKREEQYLRIFSLSTDGLVGNYLRNYSYSVDLSFNAIFGLGGSTAIYPWDSMYYLGEGNYVEDDLPPITLTQKEQSNKRELAISIMKPHGLIKPVPVTINSTTINTADGRLEANNLTADANYEVEVPEEIVLIDNEVKAVFNKWSDGNTSAKRNILLDKNKELFTIYDTQYWLDVTSSLDNSTLFEGWKNSSELVEFSVDAIRALKGAFTLNGFSGWIGDAYGTDTSISFPMDGPKQIVEEWVFDGTILVTILLIFGAVTGSAVAIIKERRYIANLFANLFSWLRKRAE